MSPPFERWSRAIRTMASNRTLARAPSVLLALGCGGVLGLATWLEPSPTGHSTHLQLGLSPCTFLSWTGLPCPMCGATTTFALMADLRWGDAFRNQPFAVLLFFMTVATFVVSLSEVVRPTGRWSRVLERLEPWEGWLASAFLGLMAGAWMYKAWLMGVFDPG